MTTGPLSMHKVPCLGYRRITIAFYHPLPHTGNLTWNGWGRGERRPQRKDVHSKWVVPKAKPFAGRSSVTFKDPETGLSAPAVVAWVGDVGYGIFSEIQGAKEKAESSQPGCVSAAKPVPFPSSAQCLLFGFIQFNTGPAKQIFICCTFHTISSYCTYLNQGWVLRFCFFMRS